MSSSASLEAGATPPALKMSSRQLLNVSSLSKHSAAGTPLLVAADAARRRLQLASAPRLAVHQLLGSLALLCLLSLLMAFLALFFLQRVASAGPNSASSPEEHLALYQVAVAMSTLTISLNLCCLFVCCIQFLLGVKLLRTPNGLDRLARYALRAILQCVFDCCVQHPIGRWLSNGGMQTIWDPESLLGVPESVNQRSRALKFFLLVLAVP